MPVHAPKLRRQTRCHGRGAFQRFVDTHVVMERDVEADHRVSGSTFFEKAFVSRVKRRIPLRKLRFWRST